MAANPRDAENQNETMILYNVTYQNCTATVKAIHINISHYCTRLKDIIQTKAKGQKAGGTPCIKKSLFYIFILPIPLLLILMACANKEKTHWGSQIKDAQGMLNAFITEIMVETEVFIDDTINLINPFTLKIVDGQLIVRNNVDYDKKHFSVFNFQSRKFIGKSFSFGLGPNEYLRVRPFSFSDDTLLVIDVLKSEALLFSRQKINECSDIPDRRFKFKNLKAGEQIDYCIQFDNMLVCSGLFHEGRFKAFNTSGDLLSGFGKYPEINAKIEIDPFQMGSLFYQVSFAKDSRQNKLAVFDEHSFSIFKKENKSFSQIIELTWNIPPAASAGYMEGRPYVARSGKDYWIGTGHIVSNDKYIFVPFSEYDNYQVIIQGIEDMFGYILVFDWEGNPVAKLKPENNISITLEIDKQGKYLYSIQSDQQTGFKRIVRIKIPDQLYVP